MFIGYLRCERCGYRTEEFMCMHHFDRGGYHVAVQDQKTLAIRLLHIPDDDVFDPRLDEMNETEGGERERQYIESVIAKSISASEQKIPVLKLVGEEPVHVPCPSCRGSLSWRTTGIT